MEAKKNNIVTNQQKYAFATLRCCCEANVCFVFLFFSSFSIHFLAAAAVAYFICTELQCVHTIRVRSRQLNVIEDAMNFNSFLNVIEIKFEEHHVK